MENKLVIAHRGDHSSARENSLRAFQEAILAGADMIEFDVRRTRDGVLVLYHDDSIQGVQIKDIEWKDLDAISEEKKLNIPKFKDAIQISKGKIKLDAEIKEEGFEEEVVSLMKSNLKEEDFIITSFHNSSIRIIKKEFPSIKTGLLLSIGKPTKKTRRINSIKIFPLSQLKNTKADILLPHWTLVKLGALKRLKKFGKPIIAWSVNSRKMTSKLLKDPRIHGIITDKVETALKQRREIYKQLYE